MKKKLFALAISSVLAATCLDVCGGGGDDAGNAERITVWGINDEYTACSYSQLVGAYNAGQGKID